MAFHIDNFVGFETGDTSEANYGVTGTPNIQSSIVRTGNYALSLKSSGSFFRYEIADDTNGTTRTTGGYVIGFAMYIDTTIVEQLGFLYGIDSGPSPSFRLGITSAGKLYLQDTQPIAFQSTNALSVDTWYYIEIYWEPSSASTTCYVHVDGNQEIAATSDFQYGSTASSRYEFRSLNTSTIVIDDFYVGSGGSGGVSDFLGSVGVFPHVCDETTATPDFAGVSNGPTALATGTWDNTAIISETNTAKYTSINSGGADGIALASGMGTPLAMKYQIWLQSTWAGPTVKYGVWGNSTDGRANTDSISLAASDTYGYFEQLTTSASILPGSAETLHLGFEQGTASAPYVKREFSNFNPGGTQITVFPGTANTDTGNVMLVIIVKDDDVATTYASGQPYGDFIKLGDWESNNAIYFEAWYKIAAVNENTTYTWNGDSETYILQYYEIAGSNGTPVLHTDSTDIGVSAAPASPSFTANNAYSLIIAGAGNDGNANSWALDSALTTTDIAAQTGSGAGDCGMMSGHMALTGTATIPAFTHSISASQEWVAWVFEFQPSTTPDTMEVAWMLGGILGEVSAGVVHEADATAEGIASISFAPLATVQAIANITATATTFGLQLADATATAIADITATATRTGNVYGDATVAAIADVSTATGSVVSGSSDVRFTHFAFIKHNGADQERRLMQPIDTHIDALETDDYNLRMMLENQGSKDAVIDKPELEYRKNGGAWTTLDGTNDVDYNQDNVRYATAPAFAGWVNSSGFVSNGYFLAESPRGTLHKIVRDMVSGLCGSTNLYVLRYQRSTNNGLSWTGTKNFIGENEVESDPDCIKSSSRGAAANKAGDKLAVLFYNTYDPTEGSIGILATSSDAGATWNTEQPFDYSGSMPSVGSLIAKFRMAEDGTLFYWIKGVTITGTPGNYNSEYLLGQYKSTNDGVSWSYSDIVDDVLTAPNGVNKNWTLYGAVVDDVNDNLYIFMRDGDDLDCYRSTDGGSNWSVVSTVWTLADNSTTHKWPTNEDMGMCANANGDIYLYRFEYVSGYSTARGYATTWVSTDQGATWTTNYIGPSSGIPIFDTDYVRFSPARPGEPNTSTAVTAVLKITNVGSPLRYGLQFYENYGPVWWRTETGAQWTGFHNSRVGREEDWYITNWDGVGYHSSTLPLTDSYGNVHFLVDGRVDGAQGVRCWYDAEPVFLNLDHTRVNLLGGSNNESFDVTNHGYATDPFLGPLRLRALTKTEMEIKLRAIAADVVNTDYLEFRLVGDNQAITNDVTPKMTIASTEKVWPGTSGTTITAGSVARGMAVITCSASPTYKNATTPSLPALISSGNHIIPKGRKSGPFFNYEDDTYYALLYHTGPTEIQFHSVTSTRDGTWAGVSSTISISAADSVWAEQGKYGYEHMIYVAIQEDSTGDVDFYEFNTSTDTLSSVTSLHTPGTAPLVACVSIAVRANGAVPQIVVGYNSEKDGGLGTERASASIRNCSGGSWTHNVVIDGRSVGSLNHWQCPTLVEGSNGLVHCWICTGPNNVSNSDAIWAHTLKLDNTLSTIVGVAGVTTTASGLRTDYEPPGQAVAWFRDEDAVEVRLAFCYQNTGEVACISAYEAADGFIDYRSPNVITMVPDDAQNFKDGTYDTANMVMIADDGDADPQLNHRFLYVTEAWEAIYSSYDEQPYIFPGYSSVINLLSLPAVSRVQKLSASYVYPGGGGLYIGMLYEEPSGVYYYEEEIIASISTGPVTHNGAATSIGVANIVNAFALKDVNFDATAGAVADITPVVATVTLYDPDKLAQATAAGIATTSVNGTFEFIANATVYGIANIPRALGGIPVVASATSTAAATTYASPTVFLPPLPSEVPVNVLVLRTGEGVEESVDNELISNVIVAVEHGRNVLDEYNLPVKEMTITVLHDNDIRSGQLIYIQDELRGTTHKGKITSVSHNIAKIAGASVTKLEVRVPLTA